MWKLGPLDELAEYIANFNTEEHSRKLELFWELWLGNRYIVKM